MICKTCKLDKRYSAFKYWPLDELKGSTCKACIAEKNKRNWAEKREKLKETTKEGKNGN